MVKFNGQTLDKGKSIVVKNINKVLPSAKEASQRLKEHLNQFGEFKMIGELDVIEKQNRTKRRRSVDGITRMVKA